MNDILEQSVTVQDLIANPWAWGCCLVIFHLVGGQLLVGYWIKRFVKENKPYRTTPWIHNDQRFALYMIRIFFPAALIFTIGYVICERYNNFIQKKVEKEWNK